MLLRSSSAQSGTVRPGVRVRRHASGFVKRALTSWMSDDHFWRGAHAGSACLSPPLARRLPRQIGGRTLRASVALVARGAGPIVMTVGDPPFDAART